MIGIERVLSVLGNKLKDVKELKETLFKMLQEDKMTMNERIGKTLGFFKYSGQEEQLRFAINTIQVVLTQDKINEDIEEPKEKCNCEKNHDINCEKNHNIAEHTEEDDEECTKIKKQLEVLKQYVSEEIKDSIDNINFWYENQAEGEECSLNDYKKYIKAIIVVVYKTKREPDVCAKIVDQLLIISRMIKIKD